MPSTHAGKIWEIARGIARPLPPGASRALHDVLRRHIDGYDALLDELSDAPLITELGGPDGERLQERRDRLATALRMFGAQWQCAKPVDASAATFPRRLHGFARRLTEYDLITDDASVFPGWKRAARSYLGWWEFHRGDRRLLVKNIDRTHWEARTGADLVYVRCDPDAFVLVQYKRLEQTKDGAWIYRPDDRIVHQLARMQRLERAARQDQPVSADHQEYRLNASASFVKFAVPKPYHPDIDELLPGYYLPGELVQLHLDHGMAHGTRGGALLRVPELRYIDPQTFARLVQDRWIGSHGALTRLLGKILLHVKDRNATGDTTIAWDEPIWSGTTT